MLSGQRSARFVCWGMWSSGATDNASDYGSEDCRFESCLDQQTFFFPGGKKIALDKNSAPGWARTTNLSVNSRTR